MRLDYTVRNMAVAGDTRVPYRLFLESGSETADYLEYDPDELLIETGVVYAQITAQSGVVKTMTDAVVAAGGTSLPALNLIYRSGVWYRKLGVALT